MSDLFVPNRVLVLIFLNSPVRDPSLFALLVKVKAGTSSSVSTNHKMTLKVYDLLRDQFKPVLDDGNNKPVRSEIVSDSAISRPCAAQSVGENNERPFLRIIRLGASNDRNMNPAAQKSKQSWKSKVGNERRNVAHLLNPEKLRSGRPTWPSFKSRLNLNMAGSNEDFVDLKL